MLTHFRITNFKAWSDTGDVRLAPLTVIFGANSAGKSSLIHLLLMLKQTVMSADRKRPLQLGDERSLVELGTFVESLHKHNLSKPLGFELGWRLPEPLEIRDPLTGDHFKGDELRLSVSILADTFEQPKVQRMTYSLREQSQEQLTVSYVRSAEQGFELNSDQYAFVRHTGRAWPLDEPDKFYRISDQTRARFQNADFLADLALLTEAALDSLSYLGPLRDRPKRLYTWSGESPEHVGTRGEYAVAAILAASIQGRMLNRGPHQPKQRFDEFMAHWLKELGIIDSFNVRRIAEGRKEFEVLVRTHPDASEVNINDVGFGVSQLLPALVQAFYCPPYASVWMEQPEIHLHPQVQAEMADVFIAATQAREDGQERHTQIIIESHSEHFLNRLQRRIAEGEIPAEDVAVYFCRRGLEGALLEPLRLNEFGEIENWPENFFGDEMADLAGRTLAAMRRRKVKQPKDTV